MRFVRKSTDSFEFYPSLGSMFEWLNRQRVNISSDSDLDVLIHIYPDDDHDDDQNDNYDDDRDDDAVQNISYQANDEKGG